VAQRGRGIEQQAERCSRKLKSGWVSGTALSWKAGGKRNSIELEGGWCKWQIIGESEQDGKGRAGQAAAGGVSNSGAKREAAGGKKQCSSGSSGSRGSSGSSGSSGSRGSRGSSGSSGSSGSRGKQSKWRAASVRVAVASGAVEKGGARGSSSGRLQQCVQTHDRPCMHARERTPALQLAIHCSSNLTLMPMLIPTC
jgi:hypothetical protein